MRINQDIRIISVRRAWELFPSFPNAGRLNQEIHSVPLAYFFILHSSGDLFCLEETLPDPVGPWNPTAEPFWLPRNLDVELQ